MFTDTTVFARLSVFALCVSAFHFSGCAEFEEDIPIIAEIPDKELTMEKVRRCTPGQMEKAINNEGHQECLPQTDVKAPAGMASIQRLNQEGDWAHLCGAALIKDQWLVTAAHCFNHISDAEIAQQRLRVCVGENNYRHCDRSNTAFVNGVKTHPNYQGRGIVDSGSDVAVVQIGRKIPRARKARLGRKAPKRGETVTLFGWGDLIAGGVSLSTPFLQTLDIKALATKKCKKQWKEIFDTTFEGKNVTCTQTSLTFGACHGDSGGPIFHRGQLVGIVSGGDPMCMGRAPDLFASIKGVRGWINQATR